MSKSKVNTEVTQKCKTSVKKKFQLLSLLPKIGNGIHNDNL